MKKIRLILSILVFLLVIVACKPEETVVVDQDPVISGAVNRTINRGDQFIPLQGITAMDEEDGDLTDQITYTGNVNPNVANTYQATYSVVDSAGNLATVTITVTVVLVDSEEPLISGAADVTIMIGDEAFTLMNGVTANDTLSGDLTDDVTVEGTVNIWVPGVYPVTYAVEDEAGNEATRTRNVTVSLGYFAFSETNALTNGDFATNADGWDIVGATPTVASGTLSLAITAAASLTQTAISGGVMNTSVADFTLAKLVISAKAAQATTIQPVLGGTTSSSAGIALTTEFATYTFYFRMDAVLVDEDLEIDLGSTGTIEIQDVALYFGVPSDDEDPVITAPTTDVTVPVNNVDALRSMILRGVSAVDNIDGNITANIVVDTTGIDLTVPGTVTIPLRVSDNAGNETVVNRTVHLNLAFDTDVIKDPTFDEALDATQWGLSGGSSTATLDTQNGALVLTKDDGLNPGWDSALSPFLRNITTNQLLAENWYMFKFDVKADKARQMKIRAGLELWADPWIEDFQDGAVKNLQYQVTTEWKTVYYIFYVGATQSSAGSNVVKFEIKLGTMTYGGEEQINTVYIDNAQFYLLTMEDDDPVVSNVADKQMTFAKGSTAPDWKTYISIFDKEDGVIEVTDAMVDASEVDMDTVGTFDVVYTVKDSANNEVTHTITLTVIEAADTTPPVLTVVNTLPVVFDQVVDGTVDLKTYITAVDDVDGTIAITDAMINNDSFSLQTAGTYDVVYTVLDSSNNSSTVTITFTVNDKQGPTISGARDLMLVVGATWNPFAGVYAVDNVDGSITLTTANATGLAAFLNESGLVTTAGEFPVVYTVKDAANNESEKTINVKVVDVAFDVDATVDLLALEIPAQNDGSIESVTTYNVDGSLTVTYNGVKGWYASASKIKLYGLPFVEGNVYKLVMEAKAQAARDIMIRLVNGAGVAVPYFENKRIVRLGTDYAIQEIYFMAPSTGSFDMELQFGWESYLLNTVNTNVMDFKQFKIVPEEGDVILDPLFLIDSMEGYADQTAFEVVYAHRHVNIPEPKTHNDAHVTLDATNGIEDSKAIKFLIGEHAATGQDIVRTKAGFAKTGLTNDYLFFAFWYKGDASVTSINVWLYWDGNQNAIAVDVSGVPATGGYVSVPLSSYGKTATQITNFGVAYNHTNTTYKATVYLDNFMFVTDLNELPVEAVEPVIFLVDSIEGYADQAALDVVYAHRVIGISEPKTHNDAHVSIDTTNGYEGSKAIKFLVGEHAVTGQDIVRTKAGFTNTGLTNDLGYFAFWYKGDASITSINVWLYWDGNQNAVAIDVSQVPAAGGFVYVALSSYGKTATQILNFGISYNHTNTTFKATIYLDNFMFIDDVTNLNK